MNLPDKCPFCDAGPGQYVNNYLCGTFLRPNVASRVHQTKVCLVSERARLSTRVAELEARCKRLEELGAELRVCAGYLGWTSSDDSDCITRAERACIAWDKEAKP